MTRSPEIHELAAALAKAQSEMGTAARDGTNPHFGNQYATLASVLAACRGPLTKYQLSLVQSPTLVSAGDAQWIVQLETMLCTRAANSCPMSSRSPSRRSPRKVSAVA